MIIKNYNSTHALSNYNLNDLYTFYLHNYNLERLAPADEKTIENYSSKLNKAINDDHFSNNDGKHLNFTRVIGIIVDKHESISNKDIDKITVMFKTDDDRYILNKYVVNSYDVFTNNKEFVAPSATLSIARVGNNKKLTNKQEGLFY